MTRCTVCRLEAARRQAVDDALKSEQVSLESISRGCGLSKSALHRHRQHLAGPAFGVAESPQLLPAPAATIPLLTEALETATASQLEAIPPAAGRAQLLQRIELLWAESIEGLSASKEPIRIEKPDGSVVELPGDLRSRVGFIREARSVVALGAEVSGDLTVGPSFAIQIVMPVPSQAPRKEPVVIDIALPRRH